MKQLLVTLLLIGCCTAAQAEMRRLVLVTATPELEQVQLSRKEIRKLYLGRTIVKEGLQIIPLINRSDPLTYQVFLQKIMLMSATSYERFLLSKVFRSGGGRPEKFNSATALVQTLRKQPGSITYMWEEGRYSDAHLVPLSELWRGITR